MFKSRLGDDINVCVEPNLREVDDCLMRRSIAVFGAI